MARKKKHPEHVNHERWLVSYADFITLLFAFFVVMFSASQVDQRKVGKLARAVQTAFQELGVFGAMGHSLPMENSGSLPDSVQLLEPFQRTTKLSVLVPAPAPEISSGAEALAIKQKIEEKMAEDAANEGSLDQEVEWRIDHRGLIISLAETAFFDSGSAVVRPASTAVLDRVASALLALPNYIRVEGHTDNQPISTGQFPSNWELSTARAMFISNYLIGKFGYPPHKLAIAGYGEYHPVAINTTLQGRAMNRRVDIVVLNDRTAQQEEPPGRAESPPAER
ncbi:MAG: OmpA family protein [Acidobacteria bacterium]|nr:OmpA family protein [Acidobacteriota bacterium]MBI3655383.1 OmpA family protein [Acidobacteriota bacterium]